jgi:hypothetical protein
MRLIDLNPTFIGHGGEGIIIDGQSVPWTEGVGVTFDCPCGCGKKRFVPFDVAIGPGPNIYAERSGGHTWHREGNTFETLTLTPSILVIGECGWHGFITNGDVSNA